MKQAVKTSYDVEAIRKDFPVLSRELRPGVPLIYLDNAATSQKPLAVINAIHDYYLNYNANIHRGVHTLADEATEAYEGARKSLQKFINAESWKEIVYVRNTTEAINLVAWTWGRVNLKPGDVVISTQMEHHANIVPFQILGDQIDIELRFVPMAGEEGLDMDAFYSMLDERVKVVAFNHISNSTGAIQPAREMIKAAHDVGALVILDAAQSVPHMPVDVQDLDVDFMAFSSHKMVGPTGIGVLYGKYDLLDAMPPFLGGGDMIEQVTLEGTTFNHPPHKFEAGTPSIAQAIGFGAAVEYLENIGIENIHQYEQLLTAYAMDRLKEVPGLHVIGPQSADKRAGLTAFTMENIHPHDISQMLDEDGIATRSGHHCTQPAHDYYQIPATTRASYYLYNTTEEVDKLVESLLKIQKLFS